MSAPSDVHPSRERVLAWEDTLLRQVRVRVSARVLVRLSVRVRERLQRPCEDQLRAQERQRLLGSAGAAAVLGDRSVQNKLRLHRIRREF